MWGLSAPERQRSGVRIVLLSLLVLAHFLCSTCHSTVTFPGTPAAEFTATFAASGAATAQHHGHTDPAGSAATAHGATDAEHAREGAGDVGADQRRIADELFVLFGLGAVVTAVLWLAAAPRPRAWFGGPCPLTARGGRTLLASTCVLRV